MLAYNDLILEALNNASEIKLYDVYTYILKPEYLMAIMLQTNRPKDKERLLKFFGESEFSFSLFEDIVKRFNLKEKYHDFKKKFI